MSQLSLLLLVSVLVITVHLDLCAAKKEDKHHELKKGSKYGEESKPPKLWEHKGYPFYKKISKAKLMKKKWKKAKAKFENEHPKLWDDKVSEAKLLKKKWKKAKELFISENGPSKSKHGDNNVSEAKLLKKKWKKAKEVFISENEPSKLGENSEDKMLKKKWKKNKHHGKHHKKSMSKKKADKIKKRMPWLDILSEENCDGGCTHREVCILGPLDAKPMCVHYRDLKKSMMTFKRYQKKERKAWRRFQKKHYSHLDEKLDFEEMRQEKKPLLSHEEKIVLKKKELLEMSGKTGSKDWFAGQLQEEAMNVEGCLNEDFIQMRTRIMGWFHILHHQDKREQKREFYKKMHRHSVKKAMEVHGDNQCSCMKSAMWEFEQLDADEDEMLSGEELSILEANSKEPCVQPYLVSCDHDADGTLSTEEWCCCFANVLAPCMKHMDGIKKSGQTVSYMPRCDKEGYYMAEQCEGKEDGKFVCWCVDFNGNFQEGSKEDGRVDCSKFPAISEKKLPKEIEQEGVKGEAKV